MAESGEIVWSLGCDVTIEDFDSSIEEIKVGDISLSGVVSVGELPVDVDSDRVNVMDLDVSFSVDGVHSTIIESQVVPHARIVEIGSYSPEATNEKRYAASAYSAKKIIDYVAAVEQNVINAEGNIDALNKRVDYLESHGTGSGDSHWYLGNDGKIHTDYDIVVHGNALIDGDTASGGAGEDNPVGLDEQAVLDLLEREGYVTEDDIAGLIPEVDLSDYYTTTQVDNLLSKKVNDSDVYTKEELNPYKSWWDKLMAHITVDENGNVVIDTNLIVSGDTASGGAGENNPVGIQGIKLNGQTYTDYDGDGVIDLGTISGGGGDLDIGTLETYLSDNKYINAANLDTYGVATKSWVNEQGFAETSALSDYLPKSGGTISGSGYTSLYLQSTGQTASALGFKTSANNAGYLMYAGGDTWRVTNNGWTAAYDIIHSGNIGSYAPIYDASGNVGIGTTSPLSKLQVDGQINLSAGKNNNYSFIRSENYSTNISLLRIGTCYGYSSEVSAITIYNGYVGIGKDIPQYKLDVGGDSRISGNLVVSGDVASGGAGQETTGYLPLSGGTMHGDIVMDGTWLQIYKGSAQCGYNANGSDYEPLYMKNGSWMTLIHSGNIGSYAPIYNASGNVGIGTTSPSNKLQVVNSNNDGYDLNVSNSSNGAGFGVGKWGCFVDIPQSTNAIMELYCAGAVKFKVLGTGNATLSGTLTQGSDIRFKHRMNDVNLDLNVMANAPLFNFYWNDRNDNQLHLGTSAQYWEVYRNELVSGTDFKGLDYSTLGVAMGISLAKKVKELEAEIKRLKEVA